MWCGPNGLMIVTVLWSALPKKEPATEIYTDCLFVRLMLIRLGGWFPVAVQQLI